MNEHHRFIARCVALAKKAAEEGESPLGSVILKDGIIIGDGY